MPGTSILMSSACLTFDDMMKYELVTGEMRHFARYTTEQVVATDRTVIGFTAYRGYPRTVASSGKTVILLEGTIYNKDEQTVLREIKEIASSVFAGKDGSKELLGSFVQKCDGEFLLTCFDGLRNRLLLANDVLGRLPVFYAASSKKWILSREPKFIVPFLSSASMNRDAVMTYLMYGFTFGQSTLVEGVTEMEPSTILEFNAQDGAFHETVSPSHNTEVPSNYENVATLEAMHQKFSEAVRWRAQRYVGRSIFVSLSGGLDSRVTLAETFKHHPDVTAVTLGNSPESSYAHSIAMELSARLKTISCDDPGIDMKCVSLKDGLDSSHSLGLFHAFLQQLVQEADEGAVYWTGIYGGELTRYLHPTSGISSDEHLAAYLLSVPSDYKYSTRRTLCMIGVTKKHAYDVVLRHISTFRESDPHTKYVTFRHEYDRKAVGHAEDRNRFYVWTTTPFASPGFVKLMTTVAAKRKNTRLFRDFIRLVDPRLCTTPYYNLNLRLNNDLHVDVLTVVERMARHTAVKSLLLRLNSWSNLWRRHERGQLDVLRSNIIQLLDNLTYVNELFEAKMTKDVVLSERDPKGLSRLYILLLYMQYIETLRARVCSSTC